MDRDRFIALWRRCRIDDARCDGADIYEDLEAHYAEPHRYYHTGKHIDHCLRQMDAGRSVIDANVDTVEMALWFHDAIYDAEAGDNEQRSANWFRHLADHELKPGFIADVERLIVVTEHKGVPRNTDECYVVDVDLSSFGLPWPEFQCDSQNVRREFPSISDNQYARRQATFLRHLLARSRIYSTEFYRARLEDQARSNIRRHIALIEEKGMDRSCAARPEG